MRELKAINYCYTFDTLNMKDMKIKYDINPILLDIYNDIESKDISKMEAHLYNGKMGLCIYYFWMAKYKDEDKYREKAESLMDEVYEECKKYTLSDQISFETGLAGIAFGITYLVRNGFMEADLDEILQDIDDFLFKRISIRTTTELSENPQILYGIAFYLTYTIKYRRNEASEFVLLRKELLIHILNALDMFNNKTGYIPTVAEPFLFDLSGYLFPQYICLIGELYQLGLYKTKLERIIEALTRFVRGAFPVSQANRLYLLAAIYHLINVKPIPAWEEHIRCLEESIDIEKMLHEEFRDKSVTINNGMAGILLFLNEIPETKQLPFYNDLKNKLAQKICASSYFTPIKSSDEMLGIINGPSGIAVSLIINENIKNNEV